MEAKAFIDNFREQFIDADEITVGMDTRFRDLPTWDSLTGMSILVMIQDDYQVSFTAEELKQCNTVQEVYDKVSLKQG
ncbi:acyl carrier protein [Rufibacter glacialis]|uniref:Acyl carrier protein n=1 Tax=Rufibacter glacialis TaxID=1259555 RepID=A0A5M8QC33_9BACT|nr:acyl carrier protein [Rufibacter glacialis]KAA6432376.1 acyl carrier protein [Rufibacter glacialis]GGK78174.1 hypothetical protein GCM10011405_27480 [Rufibacter glacialis]